MSIRIKNWSNFQHYKNRRPPWIRLYRDILDDPEFYELDGDDFKYLVMLWLIASEDPDMEGKLPSSKTLAWRLRISEENLLSLICRLNNWIISDHSMTPASSNHTASADQIRSDQTKEDKNACTRTNNNIVPIEHDNSKLQPENKKLSGILFEYFPESGQGYCDEWAVMLNRDFGKDLDLEKLFKEIGESNNGNTQKVKAGNEYRHIRTWCRNASKKGEFLKETNISNSPILAPIKYGIES